MKSANDIACSMTAPTFRVTSETPAHFSSSGPVMLFGLPSVPPLQTPNVERASSKVWFINTIPQGVGLTLHGLYITIEAHQRFRPYLSYSL